MSKKPIIGIMAATNEGVIGCSGGNGLPWDYPEELEIYRARTKGAIIIAGRKTFQVLPEQAYKTRTAIVLSRTLPNDVPSVLVARSPEETLSKAFAVAGEQKIFMIGGGQTAREFLRRGWIDTFFLTRIHKQYAGDARMDLDGFGSWSAKIDHSAADFTVYELRRPGLPG